MNFKKLKNIKTSYLVAALAAGIFIMILSNTIAPETKKEDPPPDATTVNTAEYDTESKLKSIIESIEGVSDVKVFITYENNGVKNVALSGEESVSSNESKETSSVRREPVTVKDGSVQSPFVEEEIMPQVRGVIIAARGIDNPELEIEITDAVSVVLGVDLHRVRILHL